MIYVKVNIHINKIFVHIYVYTIYNMYTNIYIYIYTNIYIFTYIHACMHAYIHIHVYVYVYTHQIIKSCSNLWSNFQLSRFAPRQRPLSVGLHRRVLLLRSAMRYLHHPAAWSNPPNKNQQTSCLKPAQMGFDQTKW
jgi:hypothetical protein